ncbi:MAG TPA: metallophosphoesterase [Polyangia bacterium]|nr:metallophosphoesterase [Polyangia bacterium]
MRVSLGQPPKRWLWLPWLLAACSSGGGPPTTSQPKGGARDWAAHPVFALEAQPAARVWVASDIHGGIDRFIALLQGQSLIDANRAWSAGVDHLYVLGDLIDKAEGGLSTIRFLQGLQAQAAAAGGEVVVTMGNHEAEFLANPMNDKASPFLKDLADANLDPVAVAAGADVGAWMRALPIGIVDGDWFFSHAGNTRGLSLAALEADIRTDVDDHGFGGRSLAAPNSILEAELWWETADPTATADASLAGLPAKHLVFGHDPAALGQKRGSVGQLLDGRLFPVDAGMSPAVNDSQGALLLLERDGTAGTTTVSAAFPAGPPGMIFQE